MYPRFQSEVQHPALSVARAKRERRTGPSYGKIGPFDPGIPHGNCVSSFESDLMRGFRYAGLSICSSHILRVTLWRDTARQDISALQNPSGRLHPMQYFYQGQLSKDFSGSLSLTRDMSG